MMATYRVIFSSVWEIYIYIPDRISLTEWKVSTLLQMVYIGSFCSYKKTRNQAFL